MADEGVKLLTAGEIAAMRADIGREQVPWPEGDKAFARRWSDARIVATLEALTAEREEWRATCARIIGERDEARTERDQAWEALIPEMIP